MSKTNNAVLEQQQLNNEILDREYWFQKAEEYAEKLANHPCAKESARLLSELNEGYVRGKKCYNCEGTGVVEVYGDGANFEWDVVDLKKCPVCS